MPFTSHCCTLSCLPSAFACHCLRCHTPAYTTTLTATSSWEGEAHTASTLLWVPWTHIPGGLLFCSTVIGEHRPSQTIQCDVFMPSANYDWDRRRKNTTRCLPFYMPRIMHRIYFRRLRRSRYHFAFFYIPCCTRYARAI